jgi:hypothetical protein
MRAGIALAAATAVATMAPQCAVRADNASPPKLDFASHEHPRPPLSTELVRRFCTRVTFEVPFRAAMR